MRSRNSFATKTDYDEYLRVEFAAIALPACITMFDDGAMTVAETAQYAVLCADAMIRELNKAPEEQA